MSPIVRNALLAVVLFGTSHLAHRTSHIAHGARPAPDFSGRWRLTLATRPITGGPTTAVFGLKLTPPEQVDLPPLTRTGERPASGTVAFQSIIGADGRLADLEPITATIWSGFLPDLVRSMTESQRRQQFRAARLNREPVAVLFNSVLQAGDKPQNAAASQSVPLPHDLVIEHTATTLTSRRTTPVGVELFVYALDGTASRTRLTLAAPTAAEWEHVSRWDGEKLVTTTATTSAGGAALQRTETRWLESSTMVVETVFTTREGVPGIVKRLSYERAGSTGASRK